MPNYSFAQVQEEEAKLSTQVGYPEKEDDIEAVKRFLFEVCAPAAPHITAAEDWVEFKSIVLRWAHFLRVRTGVIVDVPYILRWTL